MFPEFLGDYLLHGGSASATGPFLHRYFPHRYFLNSYFPGPPAVAPSISLGPFLHSYFPNRYFFNDYFPGPPASAVSPVSLGPFLHTYFPNRYFFDDYFPGPFPGAVGPTPIQQHGGGEPVRLSRIPPITARLDLDLPRFQFEALVVVTPTAPIRARLTIDLGLALEASTTVQSAPIAATMQGAIGPVELVATASVDRPRRLVQPEPDDEDLLLAHYLLAIKD